MKDRDTTPGQSGQVANSAPAGSARVRAVAPPAAARAGQRLDRTRVAALQRSAGNSATAALIQRVPAVKHGAGKAKPRDRPADVVEAIVHVMSNRGLAGDVGDKGENLSSPRYATDVTKTVLEPDHIALLRTWFLIAVDDESVQGNRGLIADAAAKTAPLVATLKSRAAPRNAADLSTRYAAGLEALSQRGAREEVDHMIESGVAAGNGPAGKGLASADDQLRVSAAEARKLLTDLTSLTRKTAAAFTSDKLAKSANKAVSESYDKQLRAYLQKVFKDGEDADAPELVKVSRSPGANFADSITVLKGGLDGVNAILTATDPKAREALLRERSNYFGTVARNADINALLWKFVSGTIAFGGATVYGVARIAGNTKLAEGVLDATVKGVANVGAALNLVGLIHGAAVILDPDSTPNQKAEAAIEVTTSTIGLVGFASRWFPRLAFASRWSGPISISLAINFKLFKMGEALRHRAQVGMNRLDWGPSYRATKEAALAVQQVQRRLAVAYALLATETDPRRKTALQDYTNAFRLDLIGQHLQPFLEARLAAPVKGQTDDLCPPALRRRFEPLQAMLGPAAGSDEAALMAAATFLLTVDKAFAEWDLVVMDQDPPAPHQ